MSIVVANWKEYGTVDETKQWIEDVVKEKSLLAKDQLIICPPFTLLTQVGEAIKNKSPLISLGAQDVSQFEKGSHTGDIAASMLHDSGALHVIIGHSERRKAHQEDDALILEKIKRALENNLIPIVAISHIKQAQFVKSHYAAFAGMFLLEDLSNISTGKPDDLENKNSSLSIKEAETLLKEIKELFADIPILYGGSVDKNNITAFLQAGFAGVVIGARSLNSSFFLDILRKVSAYAD